MSANFDVALQLGIKALDTAERIRRAASDGLRANSNKSAGRRIAVLNKHLEADDLYASDVVELAIRVVTTCMFNRHRWGVSRIAANDDNQLLIPTTASMEAYVKRLRLERVIDKQDSWFVSKRDQRSNSFDAACDELMGLNTPSMTHAFTSLSASATTPDIELPEASESYGDSDEGENLKASDTPSAPYNRKRQQSNNTASAFLQQDRSDFTDAAEAMSPSTSNVTKPKAPKSSSSMSFIVPHRVQKILSDEYPLRTENLSQARYKFDGRDEAINSLASASAKITLKPKRVGVKSSLFSTPLPSSDEWTEREGLESVLAMDEISDIMLRICVQLDNLASRKPNFYGIFKMQPLVAELDMLKRRLKVCIDFIVTGKSDQVHCLKEKPGRNAPMMEGEDFDKCADIRQIAGIASYPHPPMLARSTLLQGLRFRDATGRIFWEDYCCHGEKTSFCVQWSRFAEAFERVYGVQPPSVMDRFREALDRDSPKSSFEDTSPQPSTWGESEGSCPSPLDSLATGKNKMFRLSPLRKKRRSHMTRWFRKNIMQCPTVTIAEYGSSDCETCGGDSQEDQSNAAVQDNETNKSTMVFIETFSKFCTDYGGLFEGFVAVTDPGTHIECLGTVEDLSKVELHEMGLLEENDELVPDGEVEERSFIFKPCILRELLGLQILQLSCGGQHAAILVEGGEVYTWGKGGFGRLGHGDTRPCSSPRKVAVSHRCSQVACGFAYTSFVTQCGGVYSFGAGENGRLGVGDEHDRNRPTRVLVRSNIKVDSVYAGSVHTCFLTTCGDVYSFGKHEYTGHGSFGDIVVPKKLDAFGSEKICQLSVGPGGYHTIALTRETRRVYTWGHNRVGQLGFPISEHVVAHEDGGYFVPRPTWVKSVSHLNVTKVVAGWGHSALLTHEGAIFTCGRNFQGQLGSGQPDFTTVNERGHPYQCCFRPVKGELSNVKISQLACGGEHSIALSEDEHSCFSFGKGHKGQLGLSSCEARYVPTLITRYQQDRRQILEVACGNNCTLVLRGRYKVPSLFELCREVIISRMTPRDELPPVVRSILYMQNEMDCSND